MTSPAGPEEIEQLPEAVVDEGGKGFSAVWLLPLVALLVGAWLAYKTLSEKGPEIQISFETAEGIEEGKTKIKFRDVTIGSVDRVKVAKDLKSVVLTATMTAGTEKYLTDASRFWVVRPRVGAGGVTGLSTLFSGAYIAFEPNDKGKAQRKFVGLERPPIVTIDKEGTKYHLRAETLGSLSIGAPVYFRELDVGEVTDYKLAPDYSYVDIGVFVQAPYDKYVREGTRFWNAGGLSLSMTASGVRFEMESLVSLLSGGVSFETLPELRDTPVAKQGAVFKLYNNRSESMAQPITRVVTYALRFGSTVRGLNIGAPVEYRGLRIGTVKAIELGADPKQPGIVSPVVLIDIEPQRAMAYHNVEEESPSEAGREPSELEATPEQRIEYLVEHGLRARLATGNLVTGQLFVDLDMFPDAKPAKVARLGKYPELPTLPSSLQGIISNVNRILAKLEQSDLEGTLTNLNELMVSTNNLVQTLEQSAPQLASELEQTLKSANSTMKTLEASAAAEGVIGSELQSALKEVAAAARSIRVMVEYLERHPEALLKGKGGNP
ncbi:MAG TPA: MCE family protein [Gammaproteobacteria bacterium]|nr:MCE family protein [Gammaproteobacteria bacterium]